MDINQLRDFFLYCTLINIGLMLFTALFIAIPASRKYVGKMHAKWYGIKEAEVSTIIYKYLGTYKLLIIVFNLVPYLALRVVG